MRRPEERDQAVRQLCEERRIFTMDELKMSTGTKSTMTVFRALVRLRYLVSYSHRGQFYTLPEVPEYDELGLWSCRSVMFSDHGNLLQTVEALVNTSDAGYIACELEGLLNVEVKHTLLQLVRRKRLTRMKLPIGGRHVYVSIEKGKRCQQELNRSEHEAHIGVGVGLDRELVSDELRAGITLFFSLLDEKQRRLYAGLEAGKLGHGGDRIIAGFLKLDPHTVAKGRQELFGASVERGRVRATGGGRKRIEKKRQT